MHDGVFHLATNMLFLWVFGLITEGKLGWWRFLAVYLAIAISQAAVEQAFMLGYQGLVPGSLGASAAIYGIMVIAALWAPMNNIDCAYFYFAIIFGVGTAAVPVGGLCAFYVGLDLLAGIAFGGAAGSSILHLMGAAIGAPIGVLLLKRGVVDCEGWDAFSRWDAIATSKKKQAKRDAEAERRQQQERERSATRDRRIVSEATTQFDAFLADGNPSAALTLYEKLAHVGDGLTLDPPRLRRLIKGLQSEERWSELAPLMAKLADADPERADRTRLQLAQVCVAKLGRPGRAVELLDRIEPTKLTAEQQGLAAKIANRARAMQAEGVVELDDDDAW